MENYSYIYKYTNVKTIVKRKQITTQTYISIDTNKRNCFTVYCILCVMKNHRDKTYQSRRVTFTMEVVS